MARQDVRLDITDLYVFRGEVGTVFVMDVNHSLDMEVTARPSRLVSARTRCPTRSVPRPRTASSRSTADQ